VSSVSSSSALHGSLSQGVGDLALLDVETLGFGVGSQVLEQTNNVIDRFLWETTDGVVDLFAQCLSGDAVVELPEGNDGLVLEHSLEVMDGLVQVHSFHSSGNVISVLEVSSQVVNSAFSS